MPVYKVNAVVLRRNDLGETDRILRLLTRECGRVDAVAKGSRRGASKLSGATELFTMSRMLLATGKSLDIISQCEIRESFPRLRGDLPTLSRAAYLCELVDRFLEEREPNPDLFDLLLSGLYLLQRAPRNPDVIVHGFELHLLDERGYRPVTDHCVRCNGEINTARAGFSPSLGGTLCARELDDVADSISIRGDSILLMQRMMEASVEELVRLDPDANTLGEVAKCLKWHIRCRIDRDLRSGEFLEMIRMTQ